MIGNNSFRQKNNSEPSTSTGNNFTTKLNGVQKNSSINSDFLHTDMMYQPVFNCCGMSEPLSLPIYPPVYQSFTHPFSLNTNNFLKRMSNLNLESNNLNSDNNNFTSLPVGIIDNSCQSEKQNNTFDTGSENESLSNSNTLNSFNMQRIMQQMNELRENNNYLCMQVRELRAEVNMLKQQQQNSKGSDREYEPGMLADVIREVRDAARVRENALIAKVKHMIEEKQMQLVRFYF